MIDQRQAADIFGLSLSTFRRRVNSGDIALPKPELNPYLKRPRRILYDIEAVKSLAIKSAPPPPAPNDGG